MKRQPFEDIVVQHGPAVLRVCRAVIGYEAAEDAWSETFLAALRAYPDLDPGANVEAWLVTIAKRKAIDQHRAASRNAVPVAAPPVSSSPDEGEAMDDDLWSALRALPAKQREAVAYHHLAGLPYAQVAVLLGNSEAAARRASADGIRKLRTIYRGRSR